MQRYGAARAKGVGAALVVSAVGQRSMLGACQADDVRGEGGIAAALLHCEKFGRPKSLLGAAREGEFARRQGEVRLAVFCAVWSFPHWAFRNNACRVMIPQHEHGVDRVGCAWLSPAEHCFEGIQEPIRARRGGRPCAVTAVRAGAG